MSNTTSAKCKTCGKQVAANPSNSRYLGRVLTTHMGKRGLCQGSGTIAK